MSRVSPKSESKLPVESKEIKLSSQRVWDSAIQLMDSVKSGSTEAAPAIHHASTAFKTLYHPGPKSARPSDRETLIFAEDGAPGAIFVPAAFVSTRPAVNIGFGETNLITDRSEDTISISDTDADIMPPSSETKVVQKILMVKGRISGSGSKAMAKISLPPSLQTIPEVSHTFRFRSNSSASSTITTVGLFGICGAMALTSTTVGPIAGSVRLMSVRVWLPAATVDSVLVYWGLTAAAGFIKEQAMNSATPDGITVTGCREFKPPKGSLLAGWLSSQLSGSNTVMTIAGPAGMIIDVRMKYTLLSVLAGYSAITVASATAGRIYYLGLDGSSNVLQAQGVSTTV